VTRFFTLLVGGLLLIAPVRSAADESDETRLRARLGPDLAAAVIEIVRSASAQGLSTSSLVARALEGASRQADGAAILHAVQRQEAGLMAARRALGSNARPAELDAGAGALLAGVPEDSLTGLRRARPSGSLVIPLIVLSDFMARGVPPANASGTVLAATRAGAGDPALLRMRERINERIRHGEAPMGASREGLRELLAQTDPRASKRSPAREPREGMRP
jgi:hypothetical protein